jgi:hypothetical protein
MIKKELNMKNQKGLKKENNFVRFAKVFGLLLALLVVVGGVAGISSKVNNNPKQTLVYNETGNVCELEHAETSVANEGIQTVLAYSTTYFNGRYYHFGGNFIGESEDGKTWNIKLSVAEYKEIFGDAIFLRPYEKDGTLFLFSSMGFWSTQDCETYQKIEAPLYSVSIQYHNGKYFINKVIDMKSHIAISEDLINWELHHISDETFANGGMTYVNGIYFFHSATKVYYSEDLLNWSTTNIL